MSSPPGSSIKRQRLTNSRISLSGRKSLSGGQSALPRPTSSIAASRIANTQPTYDFLTGGHVDQTAQPLRRSTSVRQPVPPKQDSSNDENLRARINTLEYELKNTQQERGLLTLQHEKELRDLQARRQADFKKAEAAESASRKATTRCDALAVDLRDVQNNAINEKSTFEKRLRDLQEQNASLREDAEDAQARLSDQGRGYEHQMKDVEAKRAALQGTVDKMKQDLERHKRDLESTRAQFSKRDAEAEDYERRLSELKTHTGDSETLAVVQRELNDQVTHIRKLESLNREQLAELRRLRDERKGVEVVEEQKRSLQVELDLLKDVQRQLGDSEIRREVLEDERRAWMGMLGHGDDEEQGETEFSSPEAVVRALVQERVEHASLVDTLGKMEAEMSEKNEMLSALDQENSALKKQVEGQKATAPNSEGMAEAPATKAYKRMERQRTLAVKEVEYLKAQLKTYDTEETVLMENQNFDTQRVAQVKQLEAIVDQYRNELQTLHSDLSQRETTQQQQPPQAQPSSPRGTKRPLSPPPDESSSQLGLLLRKNKNLQAALAKQTETSTLLARDLSATKSQLKTLQSQLTKLSSASQTRILQLNTNPTAEHEAIKTSTLRALQQENKDLLSQLQGRNPTATIPASVLDAMQLELAARDATLASVRKSSDRLRAIWTDKAAEFVDVIASVLGYRIKFLPNGKVRVSSIYYRAPGAASTSEHQPGADLAEADQAALLEEQSSITFDGENGTMKIAGGTRGAFAREIEGLVRFWVQDKGQIPCFLAAMTLEFFDKAKGAG